jgi:hypothetical protein
MRGSVEDVIGLEVELHQDAVRRGRVRMEALLHPEFVEFGRSGRQYTREDVLAEFTGEVAHPMIHAEKFELAELAEGVVLLTYRSAHVDADGKLHRHSLRSSVWVWTETGWQMRFHQGTATAE